MRRSVLAGILIVIILILAVGVTYLTGAGGSSTAAPQQVAPPSGMQPVNGGLAPVTASAETPRYIFEEVTKMAEAYPPGTRNGSTLRNIYYIAGKDVDADGKAASWMYGIRDASGASFLIYDVNGWRQTSVADTFPDKEIDTGSLFNLNSLFRNNGALLAASSITSRQIEVYNTTYYITVREGAVTHVYAFDAGTGALISDHEE